MKTTIGSTANSKPYVIDIQVITDKLHSRNESSQFMTIFSNFIGRQTAEGCDNKKR